jgi:16S rRNA G966 N2-methylase RsmD
MSKERELIKDMKILLECTTMGGLQRNADVLIGRAIELLAQPEQAPVLYRSKSFPKGWFYVEKIGDMTGEFEPLYLDPPTRKPLTNTEQMELHAKLRQQGSLTQDGCWDAIEVFQKFLQECGIGGPNE